ncbi:MAG: hypothetical protein QOE09_3474 [Ilumatobacteraceae bacterium]|jgi:uncharacterized protein YndB with AHSA1/START domain
MPDLPDREDLNIERTTDLDLGIEELWGLISTAEGWSSWLVDETDVVVVPHSDGAATHDGIRRAIHIDRVDEGRGVAFTWRDRDEPSSGSFVQLDIVELPSGGSRLRISERFIGASARAELSSSVGADVAKDADTAWQVRFVSLWLLALHSTVLA